MGAVRARSLAIWNVMSMMILIREHKSRKLLDRTICLHSMTVRTYIPFMERRTKASTISRDPKDFSIKWQHILWHIHSGWHAIFRENFGRCPRKRYTKSMVLRWHFSVAWTLRSSCHTPSRSFYSEIWVTNLTSERLLPPHTSFKPLHSLCLDKQVPTTTTATSISTHASLWWAWLNRWSSPVLCP